MPCAAHSLNLIGSVVVEACKEAVNFFGVLQSIYNFFSERCSIQTENLENKAYVVQSVSETRWSAISDAMRALFKNHSGINISSMEQCFPLDLLNDFLYWSVMGDRCSFACKLFAYKYTRVFHPIN